MLMMSHIGIAVIQKLAAGGIHGFRTFKTRISTRNRLQGNRTCSAYMWFLGSCVNLVSHGMFVQQITPT